MNEVEKMYKTIFGEFAPNCSLCVKLVECEIINNTHNCNKFQCDYQRLFTAEKQLWLIKWLSSIKDFEFESVFARGLYIVGCRECVSNNKHWAENKQFEEALAELINNLWQDLTAEERKQIKELLSE